MVSALPVQLFDIQPATSIRVVRFFRRTGSGTLFNNPDAFFPPHYRIPYLGGGDPLRRGPRHRQGNGVRAARESGLLRRPPVQDALDAKAFGKVRLQGRHQRVRGGGAKVRGGKPGGEGGGSNSRRPYIRRTIFGICAGLCCSCIVPTDFGQQAAHDYIVAYARCKSASCSRQASRRYVRHGRNM